MMCRRLFVLGMVVLLASCAPRPTATAPSEAAYVLVYLRSGPRSGAGTKEARQQLFAGHMANIQRLADEGSLLMAGPFEGNDESLRGLFLFDRESIPEARVLVETDPGVKAGEFEPELTAMRGTPALRSAPRLYAEAKAASEADPEHAPSLMRMYVFVRASDVEAARGDLARAGLSIVWSGRTAGNAGVLVVDSTDAKAVAGTLEGVGATAVGWYSTSALMGLRPGAR